MGFLSRLFGRDRGSKHVAKERLQLVLSHDRMKLPPALLGQLKDDLIKVISGYVEIDEANINVELTERDDQRELVASIPIIGMKRQRKGR
ncbi:MAG: cell division topological specificity factor MinE [Clostridia bacterium]